MRIFIGSIIYISEMTMEEFVLKVLKGLVKGAN